MYYPFNKISKSHRRKWSNTKHLWHLEIASYQQTRSTTLEIFLIFISL